MQVNERVTSGNALHYGQCRWRIFYAILTHEGFLWRLPQGRVRMLKLRFIDFIPQPFLVFETGLVFAGTGSVPEYSDGRTPYL